MRALCLTMMCCAIAWAQIDYTYDINGRRVEGPRTASGKLGAGSYKVESAPSINGRLTPLERVEERIIETDGSKRVVERLIRRYDPNGNPGQAEKVRIEERKNPDGTTATETLTWRADVNGRFQLAERARGETRPAGDTVSSTLSIERPALDGAFKTVEKRSATERKAGQSVLQETVTWRRDTEGRFTEALRQVTERTEQNGRATQKQAQYEPGPAGRLELTSQTLSRSVKNADGSERTDLDVYRIWFPGRPVADRPLLIEQQLVERRPGADGSVLESVSVRRPAPDGSKPSGAYQKIGERVCAGECK